MLPEIESLLVIQDRDFKIQTLKSELEKIPREAAAIKKRLDVATEAVGEVKEKIVQNELAINKIDSDRKLRKNTIEKLNVQRFETSKNDEYAALGAEITRYQDMVDELETQELEFMEKSDTLDAQFQQAKQRLEQVKSNMAEDVKALTIKKTQNSTRVQELAEERAELVKPLNSALLATYDRVFAKKGNASVAPLSENQCGGCHMKVIADTASKTIDEKEVSQCENCGCFLYSV